MSLPILILHIIIFSLLLLCFIAWYLAWSEKKQQHPQKEPESVFARKLQRIEKRLENIRDGIDFRHS